MNEISLTKGDCYEARFTILNQNGSTIEKIDKVYLSSSALNLSKELSKVEDKDNTYQFLLSEAETENLSAIAASYDLTIVFTTGCVVTAAYNNPFYVYEKVNNYVE